jgi:hypothetical protein
MPISSASLDSGFRSGLPTKVLGPSGQPAAERARQRAGERADPGRHQHMALRKLALGQQRKTRRQPDEGAKGTGVEPAHQPVVLAPEDHRLLGKAAARLGDIVHADPGGQRSRDDQRHPDEAGVLQPQRRPVGRGLRCAARRAEQADADDQRHHELRQWQAQVAEPRVEAERGAHARLRIEEADVGHRAGEIAATQAAQQREQHHDLERRGRVLHRHADAQRRHQQAGGGQRGPAPAAEHRHREGIDEAQRGARQRRQRGEPEQLVGREVEARRGQVHHHHRPHHPDRERDHQRGDRQAQVARRHALALRAPEPRVFGVPVAEDRRHDHGVQGFFT